MATLEWIGGGNNQATNPNDWIDTSTNLPPALPPQPGDMLGVLPTADNPGPFTMNVRHNDLAGNSLDMGGSGAANANLTFTGNLSGKAVATADVSFVNEDSNSSSQKITWRPSWRA